MLIALASIVGLYAGYRIGRAPEKVRALWDKIKGD